MSQNEDVLKNAFLQSTISDETKIAVKAEDVEIEGGINFSNHFFEPQIGSTYLIKFLPNPGGNPIEHRSVYKKLPDPKRKGKTFHYVSSGSAKTCKALELFFELHDMKKNNDAIAEKKIDKYLSRTNQACAKIQILESPKKEEIGIIRMFAFSSFGPNATIANLIDLKLNPTPEKIKQGFEKEDIFDIFNSSVLSLEVTEAVYDNVKGRDYAKSSWSPKKRGAIVPTGNGNFYEFTINDKVNGNIRSEVSEYFNTFVQNVLNPDYNIYTYFMYKELGDPRNTPEVEKHLKEMYEKVDEIIPIIREKSLSEIANYGKNEPSASNTSTAKTDVYADSVPSELAGSVMQAVGQDSSSSKSEEKSNNSNDEGNIDVANIVNG